ncbi:MAG: DNA/RNA nuclease SfsA [Acidobacteriota bacterium]
MPEAGVPWLPFPQRLEPAEIVDRPNRFVLRCRRPDGEIVSAHLPNSGRLTGVLATGCRAWLEAAKRQDRTTAATVRVVETAGGVAVGVDTSLPNRLICLSLQMQALGEIGEFRTDRREFCVGRSRLDFLLRSKAGQPLLLEVKSVSWVEAGTGLFPDAVSARGARHLRELAAAVREGGFEAAVCFVVQRSDARVVTAARDVDPEFGRAFDEARECGVRLLARICEVSPSGIALGPAIPVA